MLHGIYTNEQKIAIRKNCVGKRKILCEKISQDKIKNSQIMTKLILNAHIFCIYNLNY